MVNAVNNARNAWFTQTVNNNLLTLTRAQRNAQTNANLWNTANTANNNQAAATQNIDTTTIPRDGDVENLFNFLQQMGINVNGLRNFLTNLLNRFA